MSEIQNETKATFKSCLDQEVLSNDDVLLLPQLGVISSRSEAEISPFIYSSPMDTVTGYDLAKKMLELNQYPVVCRFLPDEWIKCLKSFHDNENIFFATGSKKEDATILIGALATLDKEVAVNINIDVAHGDTIEMHKLYSWYSQQNYVNKIMSGTICNPQGAVRAARSGCTHIRLGIGPGSACTTRIMTGCGLPQLSTVYMAHRALQKEGIRDKVVLIADGGVKNPGDAIKYLAAGADAIMMGGVFSKTEESYGWNDQNEKSYRGQASESFQKDTFGKANICPEGATGPVIKPTTTVKKVVDTFQGGMQSAISYLGLKTSTDLDPDRVYFVRTTNSTLRESLPHGT